MSDEKKDSSETTKFAASPAAFALSSGKRSSSRPPQALLDFVRELENWAESNRVEARRDTLAFWALKAPAILVSASSALFAYLQLKTAGIVAGVIASVCISIDGLLRAGMLRSVHIRAFHDLRSLESDIESQWQIGSFQNENDNELVAKIFKDASEKKKQIQAYLKDAEAGLPGTKAN